MALLQVHFHA